MISISILVNGVQARDFSHVSLCFVSALPTLRSNQISRKQAIEQINLQKNIQYNWNLCNAKQNPYHKIGLFYEKPHSFDRNRFNM